MLAPGSQLVLNLLLLHTRPWKLILVSEIVFLKEGQVSRNWGYIIGIWYTWYGEPFCHQMGPYQLLWAETWWTLLQITFRVFFISRNPGNQQNTSPTSRNVFFWKKRAPARQTGGIVSELVFTTKTNQLRGPTNWANWSHVAINTPCSPHSSIFPLFVKNCFFNKNY